MCVFVGLTDSLRRSPKAMDIACRSSFRVVSGKRTFRPQAWKCIRAVKWPEVEQLDQFVH